MILAAPTTPRHRTQTTASTWGSLLDLRTPARAFYGRYSIHADRARPCWNKRIEWSFTMKD